MKTFKQFLCERSSIIKAGILPYYINDDGTVQYMFMTSSDAAFGGADPMIAKGHIDDGEDAETAGIREGEEELGLKRTNIVDNTIKEGWTGEIRGLKESYGMTIFTCQVKSKDDFNKPHYETEATHWFTFDEALQKVRKSQLDIIKYIHNRNN